MLVVEKLLHMAPVLQLKAKYKSDTRLLRDVARSYMYCISNIKMSTSLVKLHRANSTTNGSSWEEVNMSEQRHVVLSPDLHAVESDWVNSKFVNRQYCCSFQREWEHFCILQFKIILKGQL